MYENSGEKLKSVVSTITAIGMVCFILLGLVLCFAGAAGVLLGLIVAVVGCLFCWLSNLVLATFAQIAIDVHKLAEGTAAEEPEVEASVVSSDTGWVCAGCGMKNSWRVYSCQSCGVTKAWSENQGE